MSERANEIIEELRLVVSGKTLDALLPPLAYAMLNSALGLTWAAIAALLCAAALTAMRLLRGQKTQYAALGFVAVAFAAGVAYLTENAANYFLSAAVTSGLMVVLCAVSLAMGKPLAAWASHITRGWPIEWFWRKDVKPAYTEVTLVWITLLFVRLWTQISLLSAGDALRLGLASVLLGWPVTIPVLVFSYVYGMWRLRKLGGPGVDEYAEGKEPPWRGQVRGF